MAQNMIQLDREKLSCSICLDLLKDPVTIPCGHSYCMSCIKDYWDKDRKKTHCCPQCRKSFTPRPTLVKNTMLAELVDELKTAGLQAVPSHLTGPGNVACDFCTGRKAFKSCLVCLASFCEQHLQPHYDVARLKKHKLVEATSSICLRHNEVMSSFCHTDQLAFCHLCSMHEHKGHDTIPRAARQKGPGVSQQKILQRIQDTEKEIKVLQQRIEAINCSADKAAKDSEKIFTDLICLLEKRSFEVTQQIRSKQKASVNQIRDVEKNLHQEIAELQQHSHLEDHLDNVSLSRQCASAELQTQQYFEDVTAAVTKATDHLQAVLDKEWAKLSLKMTGDDVSLQQEEPKTRPEFLKWARQITLDPFTANEFVSLSKNNRKATLMEDEVQQLWNSSEQFVKWWQVLSTDGLTGRCYWEVKLHGNVLIAVAYKDICREGSRNQCGFGNNDKSWALECCLSGYTFRHNKSYTPIDGPVSSRIGVYLDHSAGVLSFYSITGAMTLLHRVQTTFTKPVYPGFWFPDATGDNAEFCNLKNNV